MMMFLFKAAFWLGLVLVLLPTGSKQHAAETPQIKVAEAATAATSAVSDLSQFCTRQPGSCAVGSTVAAILAQRAQDGAFMVYKFITNRSAPAPDGNRVVPVRHTAVAQAPGRGHRRAPDLDTTGAIGAPPSARPAVMIPRRRPLRSQDTLTAADRAPAWRLELQREARLHHPG